MHFVDLPDAHCKVLLKREISNAEGFEAMSEADFEYIIRYFIAPAAEEGFRVLQHPPIRLEMSP